MNQAVWIFVKGNGHDQSDWSQLSWWNHAEAWSTNGEWDWMVKLDNQSLDWEAVRRAVWELRSQPWVQDTSTCWSEAVA